MMLFITLWVFNGRLDTREHVRHYVNLPRHVFDVEVEFLHCPHLPEHPRVVIALQTGHKIFVIGA
jgi:hypothetical protein